MRAMGFFFAVFLSMLSVFLVATGEVRRWFLPRAAVPVESAAEAASATQPPGKNLLEFDFYDVEEGRRKFSMRAHLSQGDFQVESKLDQIERLTLEDGTLEVPLPAAAEGDGGGAAERLGRVLLEFESALYERGAPAAAGEKPAFQVLLRNGRGTLDDGTRFYFEDLLFTEDAKSETGEKQPVRFSSRKPVSIQNRSFELFSPSGFEGRLVGGQHIERFTFHAPVSAIIDPNDASALPIDFPGASLPGAEEVSGAAPPDSAAAASPAAGKRQPDDRRGERIAVTSRGPLDLEFFESGATPGSRAVIRFQEAVRLFPLETAGKSAAPPRSPGDRPQEPARGGGFPVPGVLSLPEPEGTRLECDHLQIELEERDKDLVPVRALASMTAPAAGNPASRLKIFVREDATSPLRTIEADSLEWLLREAPVGESSPSVAVLHGEPRLQGGGLDILARGAVFHVDESRLVLSQIRGTLEKAAVVEKPAKKKNGRVERPRAGGAPGLGPIVDDPGGLLDAGDSRAPEKGPAAKTPSLWDLIADEAEVFFEKTTGSGGARELSRLVARSERPDGVEVRSREDGAAAKGVEGSAPAIPIVITGQIMKYDEREKKATLEGTPAVKPRFAQGENRLESRRIHVHLDEGIAHFEEEVKGHLQNAGALLGRKDGAGGRRSAGASPIPAPGPTAEPGADGIGAEARTIDVEAASLAVRLEEKQALRDVRASGAPAKLLVRSAAEGTGATTGKDGSWSRFSAPEIYWDDLTSMAQLASAGDGSAPADGSIPRIEFEGGSITAGRIRFDRARWRADLTGGVVLTISERRDGRAVGAPEDPPLQVRMGRAEVDFFPGLEAGGSEKSGPLRQLSHVKRLHAWREAPGPAAGPSGPTIDIAGPSFSGRAEELEWDAARRELRFHGSGFQEIEVARSDFQGPIRAREIVFDAAKNLVTLSGAGGVTGRIVQARADGAIGEGATGARIHPASHGAGPGGGLVWDFATSILEIELREPGAGGAPVASEAREGGLELVAVRARDKVHIRNEELGVQLLGDDLTYAEASRKIHVFSPEGRPQTLLCAARADRKAPPAEGGVPAPGPEKLHKIVSQEIWVVLYRNPRAAPERGEPRDWLLATFQKDVIGSFHVPPGAGAERSGADTSSDIGDIWKMVAEKLTLHIDPSQSRDALQPGSSRRLVPWAIASGNVDFSSGIVRATAERAIYEEPLGRLTLLGSPARVSRDNRRVFEDPEITLRKVGSEIEVEHSGRDRAPLPAMPPGADAAPAASPPPGRPQGR